MTSFRTPFFSVLALALTAACFSGVNNFLTKSALSVIGDPILFTTLKNVVVAVVLAGFFLAWKKREELRGLSRADLAKLAAIGVIGGSIPFALFFTGLSMTSALSGALIHKTLVLWIALLALPFLGERLSLLSGLGIALVFGANAFIGGFKGVTFGSGELLILAATLFWATEQVIAKKVLAQVSAVTVASARMVLGSLLLIGFLAVTGRLSGIAEVTLLGWGWVALTGGLLLGFVLSWFHALKRAPATHVAALLVPATLVTNVLSAVFVTHAFTARQGISALAFLAGTALIAVALERELSRTSALGADAPLASRA